MKENNDKKPTFALKKLSNLKDNVKNEKYCEDTLIGDHGKTAKYWYVYD